MGKYTTFVGLDVHARSVKASAIDVKTGEVFSNSFYGSQISSDIIAWVKSLPQPVYCAYESGCTGFVLARELRKANVACDVIAVSTLPRSTKDKKQKCDRLDARAIRREIANPDAAFSVVWIPDEETEAQRDLCRAYRISVDDAKRAKQRLIMFLMRRGYVWSEKTKSGKPKKASGRVFDRWLDSIHFKDGAAEKTYLAYRRQLGAALNEVKLLKQEISLLATQPKNKPYIDAICHLKGIDVASAMLTKAEIGDFSRFQSARSLSCWLGTIPTDSSSGEKDKHGHITKAGNKYLRKALIEGYSGAALWKSGYKEPPQGTKSSATVASIAQRANTRLFKRYTYLTKDKHKSHNTAKVASVSELIRWIWVIGLEVECEQEKAYACSA